MLVNGETGKVAGDKPVDRVKVVLVICGGVILVGLLVLLGLYLFR